MLEIGEKISFLRKAKLLSQEELANELKISKQSIFNYESGKRQIPIDVLFNIANFFGVPIADFFNSDLISKSERSYSKSTLKRVPIFAKLNQDLELTENITDYLELPFSLCQNCDYAIFSRDNSMFPKIDVNNLIVVQKNEKLKNGDYGIFKVGDDYCCRIYLKNPITETVFLKPLNSAYKIIEIEKGKELEILGRVVCNLDYNF